MTTARHPVPTPAPRRQHLRARSGTLPLNLALALMLTLSGGAQPAIADTIPVGDPPPNLRFVQEGERHSQTLADLRGQRVFLHFWGAWCPPCRKEIPEIARRYPALRQQQIVVLLVNVGEDAAVSRAWLRRQNLAVPVADAGGSADNDGQLWLEAGATITDRQVAPVFPTSYWIGANGRVEAIYRGVITDWRGFPEAAEPVPAPAPRRATSAARSLPNR